MANKIDAPQVQLPDLGDIGAALAFQQQGQQEAITQASKAFEPWQKYKKAKAIENTKKLLMDSENPGDPEAFIANFRKAEAEGQPVDYETAFQLVGSTGPVQALGDITTTGLKNKAARLGINYEEQVQPSAIEAAKAEHEVITETAEDKIKREGLINQGEEQAQRHAEGAEGRTEEEFKRTTHAYDLSEKQRTDIEGFNAEAATLMQSLDDPAELEAEVENLRTKWNLQDPALFGATRYGTQQANAKEAAKEMLELQMQYTPEQLKVAEYVNGPDSDGVTGLSPKNWLKAEQAGFDPKVYIRPDGKQIIVDGNKTSHWQSKGRTAIRTRVHGLSYPVLSKLGIKDKTGIFGNLTGKGEGYKPFEKMPDNYQKMVTLFERAQHIMGADRQIVQKIETIFRADFNKNEKGEVILEQVEKWLDNMAQFAGPQGA